METTTNNFENLANVEDAYLNVAMQTDFPGPGDENDEEENDNEDNNNNNADNSNTAADDDNPPLDEDVVHSPLTTQPGGKPKAKHNN